MPTGVYIRTKEHKRRMSENAKINPNYGFKKKHHSEKTRKKLSEINKGKKLSRETKRKISKANKGKKHEPISKKQIKNYQKAQRKKWLNPDYRKHMVVVHTGKKYNIGYEERNRKISLANSKSGHPNWQGGISFESYGIEFNKELKEKIRKRDNYRCQECFRHQNELFIKNGKSYKLDIHHIDYDKKNNNEANLISLCRNCHAQTNFDRNNWIKYYRNKLTKNVL